MVKEILKKKWWKKFIYIFLNDYLFILFLKLSTIINFLKQFCIFKRWKAVFVNHIGKVWRDGCTIYLPIEQDSNVTLNYEFSSQSLVTWGKMWAEVEGT